MKKTMKVMSVIMVTVVLFMMATAYATTFNQITGTPSAPAGATTTANTIIGFVRWIGYAIAVGMLVFIGIKYVMASANEKADLKNALIRYVIGAALIAGGVTIAGWIFDAVNM